MAASIGFVRLAGISSFCRHLSGCVASSNIFTKRLIPRIGNALLNRNIAVTQVACLQTSGRRSDLMEFFDKKDNWGEQVIRVGRPWKKDELRLKSNEDLHKLWYVLLKERNMIMTMAEEYKRQGELFPSPERLEKVEESMENMLDVVAERDRALSLLETGESCEPGRRWAYNELGIGYWHKCTEHKVPIHMNQRFQRTTALSGPWQHKFLKLRREKLLGQRSKKLRKINMITRAYKNIFPDAEIETDLSEFQNTLTSKMKGPSSTDGSS